jgi:hypothetical protein
LESGIDHGQLLLRTNRSEGFQGAAIGKEFALDFGDEVIGGDDVGEPEIPNRVEHSRDEDRHVLCKIKR